MLSFGNDQLLAAAKAEFGKTYAIEGSDDPVTALERRMTANALSRLRIDDPGHQDTLIGLFRPRSIAVDRFRAVQTVLHTLTTDENARVFEIEKILRPDPKA